jgi:hypothetical protein
MKARKSKAIATVGDCSPGDIVELAELTRRDGTQCNLWLPVGTRVRLAWHGQYGCSVHV